MTFKNRDEAREKRAETSARQTKNSRQSKIEEKENVNNLKKPDDKTKRVDFILSKVIEAEHQNQRDGQQTKTVHKSEEARKKLSSTVAAEEYERMVLVTNKNMNDSLVEARSVEGAIAQISEAEILPQDSHVFNYWRKKDYPRINNGFRTGCFTLYIDNLPENIHWKRFGSLFCPYGQVIDAFIPTKRNSKGVRFGFIRFATIGEARRAISKMNGARIDGSKIGVSFSKYNTRHSFWRKSSPVVHLKPERENVTRNNLYTVNGVIDEAKLQVLDNCLIGWCKNYTKIGDLASQMQDKGLNGFSLMRAAGNVVLMIFEDSDTLRRVKNEKSETLAGWFSRVKVWSENLVVECRRVWVVCEGIPFHAWNWGTFKTLRLETKVRNDESLSLKVGSNSFEIMVHEVEPSFKPNSWIPEEVDDSPDLNCFLGQRWRILCQDRQCHPQSVISDEKPNNKLGLHTMEAVDHSKLNIVEHLANKSVDHSDGVSLRASEDALMIGLITSHGSSTDTFQLKEDIPVVPPIPAKLRTNRVAKKCKTKKRVLNLLARKH
ncbi:hypothetical protein F3Y22_tig00110505pilonHSYRG00103 [Hibiscus syriacus]|uniref:RRM domain-containing protein n=1 Tax=Hibiscus syriacus TaxID=106335 RepID=A0A6A3ACE5_HIBSY|nr:hypothetical protein F3Y22_tig00110505pilonHSYRG00103 [Hibiscus syriacus]